MEHPFGTIKRQWGFDYILTIKGIARASADVGFMFTAYNLRRIINIIGKENFKEYLKKVLFAVFYLCLTLWRLVMYLLRSEQEYRGNFSGSKNIMLKPVFTGNYLEKLGIVRGL